MSHLRRYLEAGTSRVTEFAVHHGFTAELLVVNEYPKSGGTWIAKSLASLLDRPFTDNRRSIPTGPVVMRTHWDPTRLDSGVYVLRDGRDVMVSLFHHRCRRMTQDPRVARSVNSVYPFVLDSAKIVEQLPKFIEVEMTKRTAGSSLAWPAHVGAAINNQSLTITRYEDMLSDPIAALSELGQVLFPDTELTADRLKAVAMLHDRTNALSATHAMGRSAIRSASAGQWKECFTTESHEVFDRHAGEVLRRAGYGDEVR